MSDKTSAAPRRCGAAGNSPMTQYMINNKLFDRSRTSKALYRKV